MAYITKEIKKGIKLHCIETEKFKTNLLAMFITLPLTLHLIVLYQLFLKEEQKN